MTDPTFAKTVVGFEIFATGVFVWASVDYNRFIQFWMLKPVLAVGEGRLSDLFIACVIGGVGRLLETSHESGRSAPLYLTALPFTAAWFIVFYVMLRLVEWMKRKRDIRTSH